MPTIGRRFRRPEPRRRVRDFVRACWRRCRSPTALRSPGDQIGLGDQRVRVGASIGLAFGAEAVDTAQLMRQADTAIYAAKQAGKGADIGSTRPPKWRRPDTNLPQDRTVTCPEGER